MRDWQVDEKAGAVAVADGAEMSVHMAGELRGDIETETRTAGAHRNVSGGVEGTAAKFAPDFRREGGSEVAHADADFVASVGDCKQTGRVAVGIVDGVRAEVINNAV